MTETTRREIANATLASGICYCVACNCVLMDECDLAECECCTRTLNHEQRRMLELGKAVS